MGIQQWTYTKSRLSEKKLESYFWKHFLQVSRESTFPIFCGANPISDVDSVWRMECVYGRLKRRRKDI